MSHKERDKMKTFTNKTYNDLQAPIQLKNSVSSLMSLNSDNGSRYKNEDIEVKENANLGILEMRFSEKKNSKEFVYDRLMKKASFQRNFSKFPVKERKEITIYNSDKNKLDNKNNAQTPGKAKFFKDIAKNRKRTVQTEESFLNKLKGNSNPFFSEIFKRIKKEDELFLEEDKDTSQTQNSNKQTTLNKSNNSLSFKDQLENTLDSIQYISSSDKISNL